MNIYILNISKNAIKILLVKKIKQKLKRYFCTEAALLGIILGTNTAIGKPEIIKIVINFDVVIYF